MQKRDFSLHGAVDLAARAAAAKAQQERAAQPAATAGGGGGQYVIDVTDETFNSEVVEKSLQVPVMVDFWAEWCQPCKQLSPILEKLAAEAQGSWILAKIDIDANPQLAQYMQQMGVRGIPFVAVVVQGQLMPFLNGAAPEAQVCQATEELWAALKEQGLMGELPPAGPAEEAPLEEEADPAHALAEDALGRGDFEAAAEAFRTVVAQNPRDEVAKRRLALTELTIRVKGYSKDEVEKDPIKAADVQLLQGDPEGAFDRLIAAVKSSAGEEKNAARVHLLSLFETLPSDDPRITKARRALQAALF